MRGRAAPPHPGIYRVPPPPLPGCYRQIRTKKALKIVINEYSHPWQDLQTARFQDAFFSQCMFILISDYEKVLFPYGVYNFSLVAMSTK